MRRHQVNLRPIAMLQLLHLNKVATSLPYLQWRRHKAQAQDHHPQALMGLDPLINSRLLRTSMLLSNTADLLDSNQVFSKDRQQQVLLWQPEAGRLQELPLRRHRPNHLSRRQIRSIPLETGRIYRHMRKNCLVF